MNLNHKNDLLWDVSPAECMLLGEDNVQAILEGRTRPVELLGGANASVVDAFALVAAVVSLIDASWNLLDRLRGPKTPTEDELLAQESLRALALQAKLSELRQRELYKKLVALRRDGGM